MYLSLPSFRLVPGNLGRWVWAWTLSVYEIFTETGWGPWLRGDSALDPPGNKVQSTKKNKKIKKIKNI